MHQRKPSWLKVKIPSGYNFNKINDIIKNNALHTICHEAKCPNIAECFAHGTATFLILGNICTRNCLYCNVKHGKPKKINENEPKKVSEAIKKLNLKYVVVTSVTRDDLKDGGASIFEKTISKIKKNNGCKIEVLVPDFKNSINSLKKIIQAKPNVLGHNIEVTRNLFKELRPQGNYYLSLKLLKNMKKIQRKSKIQGNQDFQYPSGISVDLKTSFSNNKKIKTKSGLMIGLGETKKDIIKTMADLRNANVDFLTIGQYLQPRKDLAEVKKFYAPKEFNELKKIGLKLGFKHIESGPLVRSSYRADKITNII